MMDRRQKRIRVPQVSQGEVRSESWSIARRPGALVVHFTNTDGTTNQVNLSRWLRMGACAEEFAEAFARAHAGRAQTGRYTAAGSFSSGVLSYMRSTGRTYNVPEDFPRTFISDLKKHLERDCSRTQTPVLRPNTQKNYLKSISLLLPKLREMDERWEAIEVPPNLFSRPKTSAPPKSIDRQGMDEALIAAAKDTLDLMKNIWPRLAGVRRALHELRSGTSLPKETPEQHVAHVLYDHDGNFPAPGNLRSAGKWGVDPDTYRYYRSLAYPIGGDLVPCYLMLASSTGFNGQPLNQLQLSGIQTVSVLGQERLVLKSQKNRGGSAGRPGSSSTQRWAAAISDNALAPNNVVNFLLDWTMILREYAAKPLSDDLFLHAVSEGGRYGITGFRIDSYACRSDNIPTRITNYIHDYCMRKRVKYCGTAMLRLGLSEIVDEASDGDARTLKSLLGHALIETGQDNYRTTDMLRRSKEHLAGGMAGQQRWITSAGKVDTRNKPSYRDSSAATPGFICADPFDSPMQHEVEGRLCSAYGRCPACPLAAADPDESYAFARMLQLKDAFQSAKDTLGIVAWKLKYGEAFHALTSRWIPVLDTPAARNGGMHVVLSKLPQFE